MKKKKKKKKRYIYIEREKSMRGKTREEVVGMESEES